VIETTEGLDKKLSLHYYSRLRFTANFLPLLRQAASSQPPLSHVISVLGAGYEGAVDSSDLSLRNPGSYTIRAAANHAISMTSLSFDHLASDPENKGIAFIHSNPGGVDTNIGRGLGSIMQKVISVAMLVLRPTGIVTSLTESGERHAWAGTSHHISSGLNLIGPKGDKASETVFDTLKKEGTGEKVWGHMEEVFRKAAGEGGKYEG
jgi:hypothetical protein